jgi:hypothetical protein
MPLADTITTCYFIYQMALERHVWLPDFPHFTCQVWAGFKCRFTWLPAGWTDLTCGTHMLESFHLADQFSHIPTYRWSHCLHRLYHTIGIDYETPPDIYACFLIVDTVDSSYTPARIRQHREWHSTLNHLRKLFLLPDLMAEAAIYAHRQNLYAE